MERHQYRWRREDTEEKILRALHQILVHYKPMSINSFTKEFRISKVTIQFYLPTLIKDGYVSKTIVRNKHLLSITKKGLRRLDALEIVRRVKGKKAKIHPVETGHIYHWGLPADTLDQVVRHWDAIGQLVQNTAPDSFLRIVATAKAPESQEESGEVEK